ncbi:FecR domain-containing protein [Sphingobacterium sp. KU25419]|nr:FecR domain-containing protein [Sphingobacterium sp. KU25419]
MTKQEFLALLDHYLAGKTSFEEEQVLSKFYSTYRQEEKLDDSFFTEEYRIYILSTIESQTQTPKLGALKWKKWVALAAIWVMLLSVSGIIYFNLKNDRQQKISNQAEAVMPGKNKAILRLANGKVISLDEADINAHTILQEKGLTIQRNKNGQLIYIIGNEQNTNAMGNNTIETPRGGQYQVILPDGTHVWLNSETSLSYNVDFKKQRKVYLKGEAYFEVAKKTVPFIVQNEMQEIRVLGTHFNVNSYQDEAYSQTTLLEGQVEISALNNKNQTILMKPNFSVTTNNTSGISKQSEADIAAIMAWKNGDFHFEDQKLSTILRAISRWYNVQVDYNSLPNTHYTLQISKHVRLSDVLKMLEKTGPVTFQYKEQVIHAVK